MLTYLLHTVIFNSLQKIQTTCFFRDNSLHLVIETRATKLKEAQKIKDKNITMHQHMQPTNFKHSRKITCQSYDEMNTSVAVVTGVRGFQMFRFTSP